MLMLGFYAQQANLRGGFVKHLFLTKITQQSVTKFITGSAIFWSHFVVILKSDFNSQQASFRGGWVC
jgi:hypothetical protein